MWLLYVLGLNILNYQIAVCDFYDCNEALFDRAIVSATSSLPGRDPRFAKFGSEESWTAFTNDNFQYLTFEFSDWVEVIEIDIRGNDLNNEFVSAFSISYGSNGFDFIDYKTPSGNIKVFTGNVDGNSIKRNIFDTPIIARWIRIHPVRWKRRISMKVELYGCSYDADYLHFNGTSLIAWNLKGSPLVSKSDSIAFRFKTNQDNGLILYSHGTQGDYFSIQLRNNRLVLNIDLGSGLMTSLAVGSLLDDNTWHDVIISRHLKDILLSVDRVTVRGVTKGDFVTLNLDNIFYIGGVPHQQNGMSVSQNFTGCIENLYFNTTNVGKLLKSFYDTNDKWKSPTYRIVNVSASCREQYVTPITFLDDGAYIKLRGNDRANYHGLSFSFRTYEQSGLLMFHDFLNNGFVKIFLENGMILVHLKTDDQVTKLQNFDERFDDGRWHDFKLAVHSNELLLEVNGRTAVTSRLIAITTGVYSYIGGFPGGISGTRSFIGCMKQITINGIQKNPTNWKLNDEYCCANQIVLNACRMNDRCNPNPCEHNGVCSQTSSDFSCDCSNTNYGGAVCHAALKPFSCEAYKRLNPTGQSANIEIDIDGSGPLDPFPVTCQFHANGRVVTVLHHKNEELTTVDGFQDKGSFVQDIIYNANVNQIEALIGQASQCWQYIRYDCFRSKLFNSPSNETSFNPFSWWVSRYNQKMDFWGDSTPGSRKCGCGMMDQCKNMTNWCDCDAGHYEWRSDGGDLTGKEYLPVKQLRFGDTGTLFDDKRGKYTLGPLRCEGNNVFENAVTFRKADAVIKLPKFDVNYNSDIYFEFKTAYPNAVLVNAIGPEDEIRLELGDGDTMRFLYQVCNRPILVTTTNSVNLADNRWHSVFVEINRKEIRLIVDGNENREAHNQAESLLSVYLTSVLTVGGSVSPENPNGFVGCIRVFLINGNLIDLRSYAKRYPYGMSIGCVGKCSSNPCLNNGTCTDRYGSYVCDCRWTSFKGPICADDIGVTLHGNTMIKYEFVGGERSTLSENIRIGFTTTNPQGFLFGLFSKISGEYMTAAISNSGHLRIVFDFGFERQEWIYPTKHFGLGQFHDIRLRRKNAGSVLILQVDNYEPVEYIFNIRASADAQFDKIQYMYIGKNESMNMGFIGCISRVEFDDIFPVKLLFQQDPPQNIKSVPSSAKEDFCGLEPVTHPPEPIEVRPPLDLDEDKVAAYYNRKSALGSTLFLMFLLLVATLFCLWKRWTSKRAFYLTQEQLGADTALDADTAVIHSKTGHAVMRKREWPI